ncbi:MAG: hypothetical protein HY951_00075 [Bacteroidia bacterium]|nr:hypothetical protein [Bacteroidia bacterium]
MKNLILIITIISAVVFMSCEKLAEEETPICKDCYKIKYRNSNNLPKDTLDFKRLCGGDVLLWDSFADSIVAADTSTIKYFCK